MKSENLPVAQTGTLIAKAKPKLELTLIDSLKNSSGLEIAKQGISEKTTLTLIALQKGITVADAIAARTVRQTSQALGEPTVIKLVCAVLRLFNDNLNTTLQMTSLQLFEAAQIWCETFPHESLKDLILCMKRVKAGEYGEIFNRVDVTVITNFFRKYLEQKAIERERLNRQHISDSVPNTKVIQLLPKEQQQALNELMKRPNIRKTIKVPIITNGQYIEWLRDNVRDLEPEILKELAGRAANQGMQEVLSIVDREQIRRSDERNKQLDEYENRTNPA